MTEDSAGWTARPSYRLKAKIDSHHREHPGEPLTLVPAEVALLAGTGLETRIMGDFIRNAERRRATGQQDAADIAVAREARTSIAAGERLIPREEVKAEATRRDDAPVNTRIPYTADQMVTTDYWQVNGRSVEFTELTREQGREMLGERTQRLLGMTLEQFERAHDSGKLPDTPQVEHLVMFLPFARDADHWPTLEETEAEDTAAGRIDEARVAEHRAQTQAAPVNPCWCCGGECMFCLTSEPGWCDPDPHWCPACKYGGCPDCCGCDECRREKRGGWSPAGIRISHGGVPPRK